MQPASEEEVAPDHQVTQPLLAQEETVVQEDRGPVFEVTLDELMTIEEPEQTSQDSAKECAVLG